jgi:hypothetical protein
MDGINIYMCVCVCTHATHTHSRPGFDSRAYRPRGLGLGPSMVAAREACHAI